MPIIIKPYQRYRTTVKDETMKTYTIGNLDGDTCKVRLTSHWQHIWHTSTARVSKSVLRRVRRLLGEQPYRNPHGHFGRAQHVYLTSGDPS